MGRIIKQEIQNEVVNLLKQGLTAYRVAKMTNLSNSYVHTLAVKNNIQLIKQKDKAIVKNNPFKKMDYNCYYWLGFLAADGSIDGTKVNLSLAEKDYEILKKYRNFINKNLNIKESIHHNKYKQYKVQFRNKETVDFLENFGITERKSLTLKINDVINWHFVRGYIDGDGYINSKRKEISFLTASYKFMYQITLFLIRENINFSITKIKRKNIVYNIRISSKKNNIINFINYLYKDADTYLKRKYFNATQIRNNLMSTP